MITPEKSTPTLNTAGRKCTLSDKLISLMLRQLSHEVYNFNLYKTFANFYGTKGYAVLEKYFLARAEEEKKHAGWVSEYLSYSDAEFVHPEVPAITERPVKMEDPFIMTVDKEIETTQLINEIIDQAFDEGDWCTFAWFMGNGPIDGKLVPEQTEEMNVSRTALDIAKGEGSWYRKEKSIMAMYTNDLD